MTHTATSDWSFPTEIWFGPGRIAQLGEACKVVGLDRPLLVTDSQLASLPLVEKALTACRASGLDVQLFSSVTGNPDSDQVREALAAYRKSGRDGVIGLGGGSALDVAKSVALLSGQDLEADHVPQAGQDPGAGQDPRAGQDPQAGQDLGAGQDPRAGRAGSIWDFVDEGDNWKRARPEGIAPCIAVPTTAGTGSEVGRSSVIVDRSSQDKRILFHPRMLPCLVVADPELTLGLPPDLTAATGMDALAHCFEAYCARGFNPFSDGIALEGMRLISWALPRAFRDGTDVEARSAMLVAASMGATAFRKGLGAVHALSHPIGALHDVHHGLSNAILLPYVLERNAPALEGRMEDLSRILDLADSGVQGVGLWLSEMNRALRIPSTLAAIGVTPAHAEAVGHKAVRDNSAAGNPIALDAQGYTDLFLHALNGPPPSWKRI